jgi:hypothetical protein
MYSDNPHPPLTQFGDYVFFSTEEIASKNNPSGTFLIKVESFVVTYCSPTCWRARHVRLCAESCTA